MMMNLIVDSTPARPGGVPPQQQQKRKEEIDNKYKTWIEIKSIKYE